jgi:hypothetical protein
MRKVNCEGGNCVSGIRCLFRASLTLFLLSLQWNYGTKVEAKWKLESNFIAFVCCRLLCARRKRLKTHDDDFNDQLECFSPFSPICCEQHRKTQLWKAKKEEQKYP